MALTHMIDQSMLEHGANVSSANGYFNSPQFMAQMGVAGGSFHGGNGVFEGVDMGFEGELFVPPLESASVEEKVKSENVGKRETNNSSLNNMNTNSYYNSSNRTENLARVGNYWDVEELRIPGAWDLEELMSDVPSYPFLDFQVQ